MTAQSINGTAATCTIWNGGWCGTCGARHLGSHACSQEDILRRVQELLALLPGTPRVSCRPSPAREGCPCRPENGGSGVCGCTLSATAVT